MTIQQLRYFLALCQDLNYTRTAGRLYLSRQALRLSIAALENELCGPLFTNVRNHLVLTEKGQRFRAQAAPVVEQFDRMCAQAYQDIRSPALRLGISVALVPSYLPCWGDVLEQFRQQYPGIPLETTLLSNDAVCAQLQNGTLDAGLVMDLGGCAAGLARTALTRHTAPCWCPAAARSGAQQHRPGRAGRPAAVGAGPCAGAAGPAVEYPAAGRCPPEGRDRRAILSSALPHPGAQRSGPGPVGDHLRPQHGQCSGRGTGRMPPICAAFLQPEHAEHPCVRLLCSFLQEHLRNL